MPDSIETEIKLRFPGNAAEAFQRIEQRGYRVRTPRTLQVDQVFDHPGGDLRQTRRLLRVRSENGRATLTYKGPPFPSRYKSREELEASTDDTAALLSILDRLGYIPSFRYEKYRTTFALPPDLNRDLDPDLDPEPDPEPGILALDETPIGVFLELEGPEYWIDRTALRLGFSPHDYVTASYASLYQEYLAVHGGVPNMVF
jgi:adenylate cyclase, class 2